MSLANRGDELFFRLQARELEVETFQKIVSAYPQNSSNPDENRLHEF